MFYVDQYVYANKQRNNHPLVKFLFALLSMLIGLIANDPGVYIVVIFVMQGLLRYWAGVPGFVLWKVFLIPIGFLLLGVITIAITIHTNNNDMVFSISWGSYFLGFTINSLIMAGTTTLRALSSISCLYFLVLTTPMVDIIYVLKLFKVPGIIIELMLLIYRFIFIFIETGFNIYTAQSSRWGYSTFKGSINSFGILFGNLWGKSFLKSQALFTSLVSRGYENELKVIQDKYRFSWSSVMAFVVIDVLFLLMALRGG